jgi:hypothetical protein
VKGSSTAPAALLFFKFFSAPSISSRLGKSMSTPSSFKSTEAVIDLVEGVFIWGMPGLEVDSFVHEERTFDRHLPACHKVDQSEAIFMCTLMQALLAYRWLMYGFSANFCVRVSHHQLHIMTWAGCVCPLQLFIKLILGLLF